ncbi:UPF0161 protein At3g09310 [Linum grandiflorum]
MSIVLPSKLFFSPVTNVAQPQSVFFKSARTIGVGVSRRRLNIAIETLTGKGSPRSLIGDSDQPNEEEEEEEEADEEEGGEEEEEKKKSVGVKAALSVLRFYKREISPALPRSCRYVPTCSEYSMIAYNKYGFSKGTILTAWRLCRCNPLGISVAALLELSTLYS